MTGYGNLIVTLDKGRMLKTFDYLANGRAKLSLRFHRWVNDGRPDKDLAKILGMIDEEKRPLVVDGQPFGDFQLQAVTVDWCPLDKNEKPILADVSLHMRS